MSDDLMKRLHSLHKQATVERSHFYVGSCAKDAMHRIEELETKKYHDAWLEVEIAELEAKLAKVEQMLEREIRRVQKIQLDLPPPHKVGLISVEEEYKLMLAELKGQDDDLQRT